MTARDHPHDVLDSAMTGGNKWKRYLWEAAPDNDWPPADTDPAPCNAGTGPNLGCPTPITPLTNAKAVVTADLDAMAAWCRGGTFSNLGMVWGWRVLSPEEHFSEGLAHDSPGYTKTAVLMPKGVNGYYTLPRSPFVSGYSAYDRVEEGRLGTTDKTTAKTVLNNRLAETWDNMKAQGIVIYTITFALSDTTTEQLYEDCASDPGKYFSSTGSAELQAAFQEIGNELRNLRLSR